MFSNDRALGLAFVGVILSLVAGSAVLAAELPSADELVRRSSEYHDPEGRFLSLAHRLWFLETRPNGADRRSEVFVDIPGEKFEMVRGGEHVVAGSMAPDHCFMTLDGRSEVSDEEKAKHRLSCERLGFMRNYYTYLWGLPMKLRDPGTKLGAVKEATFEERSVFELKVSYEEAVGGDVWYFYFDRESFALVGYRFYHDEAKNDGEVIYLDGETVAEGLRLPKRRTWFTHADNRELGTDHLLAIAGPAPERLENGFDESVFQRWTDMRLGTGEPVYWYSIGEVYDYPSGKLLMVLEGFDTARAHREPGRDDAVFQLSRKTYIYRHPETMEVLKEWEVDGEMRAAAPIAYPYQFIEYRLADGHLETWVEQGQGDKLTRLGPGRDIRARQVPGATMFSAPVILDLDLPGGRRYQAAEHYDFIAPHQPSEAASPSYQISWVRYGDRPRFAGPGKALTHLVSWRVDRFEDLPVTIRDYVEKDAQLWLEPPQNVEEIRRLQLGD